ncbi:MAG: HPr family phosphocarrier protein [Clostridia bacterium]|nr:HPr family phosphocarrier protein [Clostridia bacterium]
MKTAKIIIKKGIDSEIGAKLIDCAWRFKSKIFVQKEERRVSAGSLMSVLSLQLVGGDEITVVVDGPDEEEAIDLLVKAFDTSFLNEQVLAEIKERK